MRGRGRGRLQQIEKWFYDGQRLEIDNAFHYVCLLLSKKMSYNQMSADLSKKGK